MKHLPVAGKAIALLFAAAFLVACSGSDTKVSDEEEAARLAAEKARMEEQRRAEEMTQGRMRLEEAVEAVGNIFYFEFDSSTLTAEARGALDAHIALLKGNDRTLRLEGHTDERGTREYNMALGERRANAVRDYMAGSGVANYRIETVSYGEEQPVGYGSGESNWSQNRRVELK